jgi:hypothetical protein
MFKLEMSAKIKNHDKKPQKNTAKRNKDGKRGGRLYWSSEEFNQLRALSLLDFKRKQMATLLKRDDRLIFSKLQKHMINLTCVEKQIDATLPKAMKVVNIDNNEKQNFQRIQKYFLTTLEFW